MTKTVSLTNIVKSSLALASFCLAVIHPSVLASNEPDPFLLQAFDGVWKMERSATTLITDRVNTQVEKGVLRHEPQAKDAPIFLRESYESGSIEYRGKKYPATTSQWGSFPLLNPDTMRLIEISLPQTRYQVLSGQGENIFSATDWQRYRFLHVFDIGRGRYITNYYSVFAEANLGERVLGRLPNSQFLNYARVVPSVWDANNNIIGYEVLMYDLDRKGINRTLENQLPVSYTLSKNSDNALWSLNSVSATPVADELDRKGHFFTGARLSHEEFKARELAAQEKIKQSKKKTNTKKRSAKKNTKKPAPVTQR